MYSSVTRAPAAPNAVAIRSPMPLDAPVTIATLPDSLLIFTTVVDASPHIPNRAPRRRLGSPVSVARFVPLHLRGWHWFCGLPVHLYLRHRAFRASRGGKKLTIRIQYLICECVLGSSSPATSLRRAGRLRCLDARSRIYNGRARFRERAPPAHSRERTQNGAGDSILYSSRRRPCGCKSAHRSRVPTHVDGGRRLLPVHPDRFGSSGRARGRRLGSRRPSSADFVILLWRNGCGELERIESNGLLLGVTQESEFPVYAISLEPSDRLLLYTDGVIEAENGAGDAFGDCTLEHAVRAKRLLPASRFLPQVLSELRNWQPRSMPQQDDITLIVIDVA